MEYSKRPTRNLTSFGIIILVLATVLMIIFWRSLSPSQVVFSNDGPLGVVKSEAYRQPNGFSGFWMDLVWLGVNGTYSPADPTYAFLTLLGPVNFAKFYPPLALLISGLCGWAFFRTLGLRSSLCTVAGIAVALNSNFFSNTCWGLGTRSMTLGMALLALAALNARRVGNPWINAILAGLAVGMGVVEGADIGVIFSLFVAAYVLWQAWVGADSPGESAGAPSGPAPGVVQAGTESGVRRLPFGILRLVLVAGFAGFMATQSLISLFDIASKTAVSAQADAETKEQKWTFATQWSLPPSETLRVLIPGLHGYRMDSPNGGNYWGRVGESPGVPGSRFSGAGEYAGVLVVLLAIWTLAQSFRKTGSVFTRRERQMVWFWLAALIVATVLAWGKYAPMFYKVVYSLPYFSSIRNPMKFMHVSHLALMILFAYGLLGLSRRYLEDPATSAAKVGTIGAKGSPFDKRWTFAMLGMVAAGVLGFLVYSSGKSGLVKHLMEAGFPDAAQASKIADFSTGEVGTFVVFLVVSVGTLLAVMRGVFAGQRAVWGAALLGLVLTIDLARANLPWVKYWDYAYKYATNSVLDILRDKPYEARVVAPPNLADPRAAQQMGGMTYLFPQLYAIEWVQHHFQYYNIQSIDVAQDPRPPADKMAYQQALLGSNIGRYWQLTNTRYVLGLAPFLSALNQQVDPGQGRFQIKTTFAVSPKPGVSPTELQDLTVSPAPNGPLALFEFTGALPRVRLYAKWLVNTNGDEALKTLTDPAFDPWSAVVVSDPIPAPANTSTNSQGGTVEFAHYSPQRIELKATATAPSVLLLNDRYDKDWRVTIDGQPAPLLRANFIMRGVQVPVGQHTVVFQFKPSLTGLKISLAAIVFGVLLCGFVAVRGRRSL